MEDTEDHGYDVFPRPVRSRRVERERRSHPTSRRRREDEPIKWVASDLSMRPLTETNFRSPRQPRRRPDVVKQPTPPLSSERVAKTSDNALMVSPVEVEEPLEGTQVLDEEPEGDNIEVEEVVPLPDHQEVQDQAISTGRQPILLDMSPSMAQEDPEEAPLEVPVSVSDRDHEETVPVDDQQDDKNLTSGKQENRSAAVPDGASGDEVLEQEVVSETVRPDAKSTSPLTLISSLHISSIEQQTGSTSRDDEAPAGEAEEGSMSSDFISSFTWEQGGDVDIGLI